VIHYFNARYTYALGLDVPPKQDKLTYFLLNATTGYCEYFASGAAILLRLAGVPTRYVTGFLVTEQDPQSGLWIARNKDAHAWAEAWDRQRNQWTIVEATVGEDAASATPAKALDGLDGASRALWNQLVHALYEYGLFGALSWLFQSYGLVAGVLTSAPLFGVALVLTLLGRGKGGSSEGQRRLRLLRNPAVVSLHRILAGMDRKVAAAGVRRDFSETLHAFSQRLRARASGHGLWRRISDWYLEYANLRYRGPISDQSVRELQQRARSLQCLGLPRVDSS
jgi:protein-glutamine gamma-glutamyltransferase